MSTRSKKTDILKNADDEESPVLNGIRIAAWILLGFVLISLLMVMIKPSLHKRWKNYWKKCDKIVEDDEISPHAPRFVMFYQDFCPACRHAKPLMLDYAENHAPEGFKLIMRDCAKPANRQQCSRITHIPKFLFQRNASDSGEFFSTPQGFDAVLFDRFVREKLRKCLDNDNNNDNNNNDNHNDNHNDDHDHHHHHDNDDHCDDNNNNDDNNNDDEDEFYDWSQGYHHWD